MPHSNLILSSFHLFSIMIGLAVLLLVFIYGLSLYLKKQRRIQSFEMPADTVQLLLDNVAFYRAIDAKQKLVFEKRIKDFLQHVTITGIGTTVEAIDKILIASGAIILIFGFEDWRYNNISEILLYKDSFNEGYDTTGKDRNILGMVGDGALKRQMILSQASVRASFKNPTDGHNTVIHEFAHLVDKADGATDGMPEYLLAHPFVLPWATIMHQTIQEMKQHHSQDINFYGTTNDAEFFAVVAEYFFERPDALKSHHPQLYALLNQMFNTKKPVG